MTRRKWFWALVAPPAALLLAWWLLGPWRVVAYANRSLLPRREGPLEILHAAVHPPATPAEITLAMTPAALRALAAAEGHAIPPTVLRDGMAVEARLHLDRQLSARLLVAGGAQPPTARLALDAGWVNGWIERYHATEQAGMTVRYDYRLAPGATVRDEGAPVAIAGGVRRRLRIDATGEVWVAMGSDRCRARVDRLVAFIEVDLVRAAGGWTLSGDATVDTCEYAILECQNPLLRLAAAGLPRIIETLLDERLSAPALDGLVLPEAVPVDVRLAVELR